MDGCSHLGIAEREDIMVRWKDHEGASQMARELHRDRPAISREIGRNGWQGPAGRRCRASAAQRKADRRRLACRRPGLMDEPGRRSLAVRPMRDGHWSPEEISGRISEERPGLAVSDSAICRAVESGSLDCGFRGTGGPQGCPGTMEDAGTGREARSAGARCAQPMASPGGRKRHRPGAGQAAGKAMRSLAGRAVHASSPRPAG